MTTSFDLILMTSEIISLLNRILQGVTADSEHLATAVINEFGSGGEYLTQQHTLDYFRELWDSELFDRTSYETRVRNGSKSFRQRINDTVQYILANHQANLMNIVRN